MRNQTRQLEQGSTKWRPMSDTPLAPWQRYSAELIQRDAPISRGSSPSSPKRYAGIQTCLQRAGRATRPTLRRSR